LKNYLSTLKVAGSFLDHASAGGGFAKVRASSYDPFLLVCRTAQISTVLPVAWVALRAASVLIRLNWEGRPFHPTMTLFLFTLTHFTSGISSRYLILSFNSFSNAPAWDWEVQKRGRTSNMQTRRTRIMNFAFRVAVKIASTVKNSHS
jgi:hypothetical protein